MMGESILSNCIIYKEGWLTKSPPITQMSRSKSWKKRYFVLLIVLPKTQNEEGKEKEREESDIKVTKKGLLEWSQLNGFYVAYWESESERLKSGSKPINAIPLEGHFHIHKYKIYEGKFHNLLALTTDERIYFLASENEFSMASWYNHIHEAVAWMGKKNGKKSGRSETINSTKLDEIEKAEEAVQIYDRLDGRAKPMPIPTPRNSERQKLENIMQHYQENCTSPFSPPSKFITRSSYGSIYGYSCDDISPPQIGPRMDLEYENTSTIYQSMDGDDYDDDPPLPMFSPTTFAKRHFSDSFITTTEREVKYTNSRPNYSAYMPKRTNSIPGFIANRPACNVPLSSINETKMINEKQQIYPDSIYDDIGSVMRDFNDVYKFTTGRAAATLSLFDTDVKLPGNSLATVNNDGVTIRYNEHEISIKKHGTPVKNVFNS